MLKASAKVCRSIGVGSGVSCRVSHGIGSRRLFSSLVTIPDEVSALKESIAAFSLDKIQPQAAKFNKEEHFNYPLFKELGDLGLLGLTVDEEFGGSGASALASVVVHEEMSKYDPAFCLSYLAHSLLFANNLNQNGNAEQKSRFLPQACEGSLIGGMGMSEPGAGTDVLGLATTAKKNGDIYVLNGRKMWITNGCLSNPDGSVDLGDVFLVYARTGETRKDISLFLVEKGMPGFSLGQRIGEKLGMRASSTAELVFDNVEVPAANLVGKENDAVICMMRNLEIERLALGAMSVGIASRCLKVMNDYSRERIAFGKPISSFGQVQRLISQSYANFAAGKSLLYSVAAKIDESGLDSTGNRLETDAVKLFCAKMGKDVADAAIQVLGGNGYIGDYDVERLWRDAKLLEIGGGTMESHEKNIIQDLKHVTDF